MPSFRDLLPLPFRWRITRGHLLAATESVRQQSDTAEVQRCLAESAEFLDHNELGCALDMLEYACESFTPSPDTFELLAVAAESMDLSERASEFRRRVHSPGDT